MQLALGWSTAQNIVLHVLHVHTVLIMKFVHLTEKSVVIGIFLQLKCPTIIAGMWEIAGNESCSETSRQQGWRLPEQAARRSASQTW